MSWEQPISVHERGELGRVYYLNTKLTLIDGEEWTRHTEFTLNPDYGSTIEEMLKRTSKDNWRPRMYLSTNPGGIGHAWFKKRIVGPHREKREGRTRFIPSTYRDNPFLNVEYTDWLEGLRLS